MVTDHCARFALHTAATPRGHGPMNYNYATSLSWRDALTTLDQSLARTIETGAVPSTHACAALQAAGAIVGVNACYSARAGIGEIEVWQDGSERTVTITGAANDGESTLMWPRPGDDAILLSTYDDGEVTATRLLQAAAAGVERWMVLAADAIAGEDAPSRCPVCGDVIDHCQGHGPIGDPDGAHILDLHDAGYHTLCEITGCDSAAIPVH